MFAARGFVGASLQDIAAAVGIRKPSLLYHFSTKEELRRSVIAQLLAHWSNAVPRILEAASSGEEQFHAVAEETLAFFSADPDRARIILRELLDRPDELSSLIELQVRPWATLMSNYIRKGQEQGRVHADVDPEAWVTAIINLVLSSVAIHSSLGRLAAERPSKRASTSTIPPRLIAEIVRVARSSLFVNQQTPAVDTSGRTE